MLIRFEVSNFRSILEPVELSMVAVDKERPEARPMANLGESLLTVAAIYGPNASGKTNVLAALVWLRDAVDNSLRAWDDTIPIEPFAFAGADNRSSEFVLECVIDGVRFEYVVELDRHSVHYEALFHYPEKKRRRIFEREEDELKLQRGLGNLSGTRDLLTPRTLALSIARRFDDPLVSGFADELRAIDDRGVSSSKIRLPTVGGRRTFVTDDWFHESAEHDRRQALALLRMADLGIDDVMFERVDGESGKRRTMLLHRTSGEPVALDLGAESDGTLAWYRLMGPLLGTLESGAVLILDELDASLHPTLSTQLIRLFLDPATNPRGAQLIFTSHDTSLLNHLNRDEVWLTEKMSDGSTRLGALAEFAGERVRRSQNLEKAYLHGRFGALPDVDRADVLRTLGLIG
ncbi:ATP/GTP-binding protein [Kibdelosporangium lantanae]|uniref:ATP/GTP-binding protein n=1 Tax=Kibdelosporangium lantanae TaxID=1497396 RepID=A0ABW3M3B4_9PSEU